MSSRTFTVFQDAPSDGVPPPKISRPNAMVTRSQRLAANVATGENVATLDQLTAVLNKENLNPATGECAGPSTNGLKKRKTAVLATKVQPAPAASKAKSGLKEKVDSQPELGPEQKKRKASAPSSATSSKIPKAKGTKKDTKGSGKKATKRTGSKKVTSMPKLSEEDVADIDRVAQADANSRCYELTVKPLADVTQAYEEVDVFESFTTSTADPTDKNVKFSTVKESSVEPEIRDYFQPTQATFPSTGGRLLRAISEDAPSRTFSTPERRKIYSAFTFSSPSTATTRLTSAKTDPVSPVAEEL